MGEDRRNPTSILASERVSLSEKYDALSNGFVKREYADPESYFGHRLRIFLRWGIPSKKGESVFHIGCGDGYMTCLLLERGFRVEAVDFSEGMLKETAERCHDFLADSRLSLTLGDVNRPDSLPQAKCDHLLAVMRDFFSYTTNPLQTLAHFHGMVKKKIIVDFDPRQRTPKAIRILMEQAGFRRIRFRAFLFPQKRRVPALLQMLLGWCETLPWVYGIFTRKKFHLWVLGETGKTEAGG